MIIKDKSGHPHKVDQDENGRIIISCYVYDIIQRGNYFASVKTFRDDADRKHLLELSRKVYKESKLSPFDSEINFELFGSYKKTLRVSEPIPVE